MSEQDSRTEQERRLHRAAVAKVSRQAPEPPAEPEGSDDESVRERRYEQRTMWVDLQIRQAMERGEFDNLPGTGKPIAGLDGRHDPDWWVKQLIEREQITGVLPPALGLRKEDAELDALLDREATEQGVRDLVEDFNLRVVDARRQLLGGPPVVTRTRDADQEVASWRARNAERRERLRSQREQLAPTPSIRRRPRWWPRRRWRTRSD